MLPRLTALAAVALLAASHVFGYTFTGSHWTRSPVTMQLQLGPNPTPLSDGSASWDASAEDALSIWNSYLGSLQFNVVRGSSVPIAQGNGYNNVFFSNSVYGTAWGTGVLAVTLTFTSGSSQTTECDVLFNSSLNWDSYRGSQHYGPSGAVYDFHRVALHEFGHVVGLDHPDQAGQSVVALMNSTISNLDTLATDDINGGQSLYGARGAATVTAPTITNQPSSQTVAAGGTASFTVGASGGAPLSYQWSKNGVAIYGATAASLTLPGVNSASAGGYACTVSNSGGSATSATGTLTVSYPAPAPAPTPAPTPVPTATAPSITTQPSSQTVNAGASATFTVSATGTPAPGYQWYKNGAALVGANTATFTIGSVAASDAASYTVRVANTAGAVTSGGAVLTVNLPPSISVAPTAQTVSAGDQVVLSVTAAGTPSPAYQWQKNGINIPGATQSSLVIASAAPTDAGTYAVVVTNAAGGTSTVPVLVTVNYSQLVNISARGYIPAGDALTSGFVLRGTGDKPLIVRGVGPTLNTFGVANPLTSAQLALIAQDTQQTLAVNNNWSASPQLSTAFQSVGAFALPAGSADAASEMRLTPGSYTTRITSDVAGASGIALAEVYDADTANARCRLINISTRGFAGSGDKALVAGFSILGNAPKHVLIRAVGPGLAQYAVPGWLADPRVDVYPINQDTAIAGNDDWSGTAALQAAFTSSGAFNLDPSSHDAALVLTLQPGAYTAVVTGVNGATGTALVEVYDLDP